MAKTVTTEGKFTVTVTPVDKFNEETRQGTADDKFVGWLIQVKQGTQVSTQFFQLVLKMTPCCGVRYAGYWNFSYQVPETLECLDELIRQIPKIPGMGDAGLIHFDCLPEKYNRYEMRNGGAKIKRAPASGMHASIYEHLMKREGVMALVQATPNPNTDNCIRPVFIPFK